MTFHPSDIIIIIIYFLILFGIGFSFSKKNFNDEDYVVAARKLTLPAFIMTLVTTWYGAILGVGEFVFGYGIVAWVVNGFFWYFVYFIFAFLFAKKINRSRHLTVADQFRKTVGKKTATVASIITYIMATPAPYVLSLGIVLDALFGWGFWLTTLLGFLISAIYVWFGGFHAVVKTDIFQFLFMYAGFGLLVVLSILQFGGWDFLQSNLPATHLTFQGELSWQTIFVWGLIAFWTLVDPNFYHRCYAAQNDKLAQKGVLWSILFWFIFDMLSLTAGLYARAAFPEADPLFSYLILADNILPFGLKGLFIVGILSIIMSTIDSFLFSSSTILASDFLKKKFSNHSLKKLTRIGIVFTLIISVVLISLFQSIIGIIYAIGTVGVSAMLLPILLVFFTQKNLPKDNFILGSMIMSFIISGYWLIDGWIKAEAGWPVYLLDIEPMYIGLLTSALCLVIGKLFFSTSQPDNIAHNKL